MDSKLLGCLDHGLDSLGLSFSPEVNECLLVFLDELLRWNRKINLTAITDPKAAIEKHLVDSLTLLDFLEKENSLLDLGSGGGIPAIPLKIARKDLAVVSVEATAKKIAFQRHIRRNFSLQGFDPVQSRVESLPLSWLGQFPVVTSRAFTSLVRFVELSLPLVAPGGRLLAMKGPEGERELSNEGDLLCNLGVDGKVVRRLNLPVSGDARVIVELRRID